MKFVFLLFFIFFGVAFADYKRLRCLVCKTAVTEMTNQINKINPKKKIQVGGYRLDDSGKVQEKLVPYARSGMHILEILDTVCDKFEYYVRATDKKTKTLVLEKLLTDDGKMNPRLSEVDIVQDADLNKSLGYYCEGIVEEFEDEIYNELKKPSSDAIHDVCVTATGLCESIEKDEL